jgi:hypothetical protein
VGGRVTLGKVEYTGFWWGNLRKGDNLEDPGIYERIILSWIFGKWNVRTWIVLMWLGIGTGGGHL